MPPCEEHEVGRRLTRCREPVCGVDDRSAAGGVSSDQSAGTDPGDDVVAAGTLTQPVMGSMCPVVLNVLGADRFAFEAEPR